MNDTVHASQVLPLWTVYDRPKDAPSEYVVRLWFCASGQLNPIPGPARTFPSLEEARASIPLGRVRLERAESDDSVILETWL